MAHMMVLGESAVSYKRGIPGTGGCNPALNPVATTLRLAACVGEEMSLIVDRVLYLTVTSSE